MTADSQLVINVATAFFIKHFIGSKPFLILTCLNINLRLLITGCNQASYVSRDISLDFMSPLGKSSASLGKGWEATGDCWHAMVSCTPHRCRTGVGTQRYPNRLCWEREKKLDTWKINQRTQPKVVWLEIRAGGTFTGLRSGVLVAWISSPEMYSGIQFFLRGCWCKVISLI